MWTRLYESMSVCGSLQQEELEILHQGQASLGLVRTEGDYQHNYQGLGTSIAQGEA